jgi:XTP/dITP diphosphohydrolase
MQPVGTTRRAVLCTSNAHKVEELAALLPGLELERLPDDVELPPEIGETFADNARIKAASGHAYFADRWVLADDSGLVVDALDGAPGVRSARFAGADATDADNTQLLLERMRELEHAHERSARFVCVLIAIAPDGTEFVAEGAVEGRIEFECSGDGGFGYDPVFVPDGETQTFAELGAEAKGRMSHRGIAARLLAQQLGVVVEA